MYEYTQNVTGVVYDFVECARDSDKVKYNVYYRIVAKHIYTYILIILYYVL